jgi:hypothetical protein
MAAFSDPQAVARYTDGPPRFVPAYSAMQRMTMLLLAERAPVSAISRRIGLPLQAGPVRDGRTAIRRCRRQRQRSTGTGLATDNRTMKTTNLQWTGRGRRGGPTAAVTETAKSYVLS